MDFVSIRIITGDVARLVAFYERATGVRAQWATEDFAELETATATLAIASTRTALFAPDSAAPGANRSVITEFLVADVDRVHRELSGAEIVAEPTTMPWGNRSLLVRDPDGNLVNFFTPVTAAAIAKFAARDRIGAIAQDR
ncbi:glyoxalase/bleomycin resistance/extradiol dioxygenase family protein [Nocardia sp. NRRL WC-3656]|uniref:VOC family protein n=1 Tax=Nocardia sp. NRRL WC-3656 TaxID=1463824 RepID=UPI0004C2DD49|nr:VOC family protein [Nocardia sp. NRRL WC-3656]